MTWWLPCRTRRGASGLEQGLADFRANLAELVRGCDENNVVPVFMTSPVLWKRDLLPADEALLWLGWSHGTVPTDADLASGVEVFNVAVQSSGFARNQAVNHI